MTYAIPTPWPKHRINTAGLRRAAAEKRLAKALREREKKAEGGKR